MPAASPRIAPAVSIRAPRPGDERAFIAQARASRALHERWVRAPSTPAAYRAYLRQADGRVATFRGYVAVRDADGVLAGVFNLSEIVHGIFKSAYLGYYAFAGSVSGGHMSAALGLVLDTAFRDLKLHRVEANVQPGNVRSLEFLLRNGFTREGYSRRYLKIGGRWRDHVRFAILVEDWCGRRRR
jgi:ribosomal-protein-alanine N-acetyltransferase